MLAIVAPEPAPWIARALAESTGPVWLFAPWDLSLEARLIAVISPALAARAQRFVAPSRHESHVYSVLGWPLALAASRAWERGRTDRQLSARFRFRAAVDAMASRALPAHTTAILAPSGAARLTFARALSLGHSITRTVIQDTPVLSALHRDLDRALAAHPDSAFLRRFRADHRTIARQRAEWLLATSVRARGRYAARALRDDCCPCAIEEPTPVARRAVITGTDAPRVILLAGFAAARNGTHEALALLDSLPDATLLVRRGEGSEPRALFEHPRVRESTERERTTLDGVDLVYAPAWCESYPPEISLALERGVRVRASERACGACVADEPIDVPFA